VTKVTAWEVIYHSKNVDPFYEESTLGSGAIRLEVDHSRIHDEFGNELNKTLYKNYQGPKIGLAWLTITLLQLQGQRASTREECSLPNHLPSGDIEPS